MEIKKIGQVGSLESSDVRIVVKPNPGKGISIILDSVVKTQFGDAIIDTVNQVLNEFQVINAVVEINDKGALDYVIRSRMQAVLCRAADVTNYDWGRE